MSRMKNSMRDHSNWKFRHRAPPLLLPTKHEGDDGSAGRDVETRGRKRKKEEDDQLLTMSVPRSMQRMVTVPRGRGMSQRMNARKGEISGMFEVRVYAMDFFRLSKINRPSSTPVTIEAKLSSRRIMSAACFDTSEPAIPIATPMSAFFNAGESFTPSPRTNQRFFEYFSMKRRNWGICKLDSKGEQ